MRNRILIISTVLQVLLSFSILQAQIVSPLFSIEEKTPTHNMHICSDGNYYYTINGGDKNFGEINQYDLKGNWLRSYPFKIDARSILYNSDLEELWVNDYDRRILKVTDMEIGAYETRLKDFYENRQSSLGISPDGSKLYYNEKGTIKIFDAKNGKELFQIGHVRCGDRPETGSLVVAVGTKYFFTWDAAKKEIYIYNLEGKFIKSVIVEKGNYGFSLSYANGYVFVAEDGNGDDGYWYAYDLEALAETAVLLPVTSFVSHEKGIPYKLCFNEEKKLYYVLYSGSGEAKSVINLYKINGKLKKRIEATKSFNSLMYNPINKYMYATSQSGNLFKIIKWKAKKMELVAGNVIPDPCCSPSLSFNGIKLYYLYNNKMAIKDFFILKNEEEIEGVKSGGKKETGSCAIAVGKKFIYTWDASSKLLYLYSYDGQFLKPMMLSKGSYGESLSFAHGKLWVADTNENGELVWYAYETE